MCNCIKKVGAKVEANIKKAIMPKVYSFDYIGFDNMHLVAPEEGVRKSWVVKISIPFTASFHRKKASGEREKNTSKKTIHLFMSYCPFCGKKYEE